MITIDSLTVRRGDRTVLDGITMHLEEGAVHGIVGRSGAGKTTLFDTLFGFVSPTSGSVTRFGRPLRRRDMAYMESDARFCDGLTGRDLLDIAARYNPAADPGPCIRLFRLPVERPVAEWSAGMKRKLALTVALMQSRPVLLLDRPFDGLDEESLDAARHLIRRRQDEGATVIVASRRFPTLETICDDIRLIDGGRIVAGYRRDEYARAALELEAFRRRHAEPNTSEKIN